MSRDRVRAGVIGGLAAIALLGVAALAAKLVGGSVTSLASVALLASALLAGGISGFMAGQGRRRRSEAKAAVGGLAGLVAGIILSAGVAVAYVIHYLLIPPKLRDIILNQEINGTPVLVTSPDNLGTLYILRIAGVILFLGALVVIEAMIVAHATAGPLPPPRPGRSTRTMPSVPPVSQRQPPLSRR